MDVLGWNLIRLRYPFLYFILQTFSFVEDTVSPFEGQYGKVPLPAAFNRLVASVMDGIGYFKAQPFQQRRGGKAVSDVVALSSFAGVKATRLRRSPATSSTASTRCRACSSASRRRRLPTARRGACSRSLPICVDSSFRISSRRWRGAADPRRAWPVPLAWRWHAGQPATLDEVALQIGAAVCRCGQRHHRRRSQTAVPRPDEESDFRGVVSLEARPDPPAPPARHSISRSRQYGLSASWCISRVADAESAQLRLSMLGAVATLSPASFDNFIAKILPKDGLRVNFDLGVGVASDRGAFYEGTIRSAGTAALRGRPHRRPLVCNRRHCRRCRPNRTGIRTDDPIGKSLGPFTLTTCSCASAPKTSMANRRTCCKQRARSARRLAR